MPKNIFSITNYALVYSSSSFQPAIPATQKVHRGDTKLFKTNSKGDYMGKMFDLGVLFFFGGLQRGIILIWGESVSVQFKIGV